MTTYDPSIDTLQEPDVGLVPPGKMSEAEFEAWCDEDTRAEWVDGEVILMSPTSVEHGALVTWLLRVLADYVENRDLGTVLTDVFVRLADPPSRRVPDIWFVAKDRLGILRPTCLEGAPDLIIEVVSPDSEARDWREKYFEYQSAGVREYWVIDPMSQHVEAYALGSGQEPAAMTYRRLEEQDGVIASTVLPGFWLRTAWLWPQTRPKVKDALRELGPES